VVDERPQPSASQRARRRGPRSLHAISQRRLRAEKNSRRRQPLGGGSCQSEPELPSLDICLWIMHLNLHGFVSHQAELQHRIAQSGFPDLVGITESFLDKSISTAALIGYTLISRLDRRDGRQGGGIALFANVSIANNIVHIADSPLSERSWHILHTHQGPLLVGLWYRPPCYNTVSGARMAHSL
jgi:hypothetical protein